ncbi:MAG: glycosyltransferase family 61 protein [Bacteroidetes bacterium]|nr:glycosyltransferase family 61 protein [Bacteroidota bacterium]
MFEHEYLKIIPATILSSLNNVYVLGDSLFHINTFHFRTSDTHVYQLTTRSLFKNLLLVFKKGSVISKAVWIIDNWSDGYFHWFTDALPRLIASESRISSHVILLPIRYQKLQFVLDSLKILNHKIVFYDSKVFIRNLLLPSHTAESGNYNVNILQSLRYKFGIKENLAGFRKIYVSREKAVKRKILNENNLLILLESLGYEIHFFEDYHLLKQIEILQQTKTLIGLHGAGLTNMLFMPTNSNILELRNKDDSHNNCYFSLASDLGMNYFYQECIGTTSDTHFSDINVSLEVLQHNVGLMEKHKY